MDFTRGMVARSKAGHDKGTYLAVLAVEGEMALVADGRKRPLERPKRKKLRHLAPTATILPETALATNNQLHRVLREKGFVKEAASQPLMPKGGQEFV